MSDTFKRREASGLCKLCGKSPPEEGVKYCKSCRDKNNARGRLRIALGFCIHCNIKIPDGFAGTRCPPCVDKARERNRQRKAQGLCVSCQKRKAREARCLCQPCQDKNSAKYQREKAAVYEYYGGYRCACCSETEVSVLTIDHVHNDGNAHRKSLGVSGRGSGTTTLYSWLVKNNFPPGFQILCRNCNWSKHIRGGECFHEAIRRGEKP